MAENEASVDVLDLFVGEATFTFKHNERDVSVTYNPNAYTPDIEAGWAKMESSGWMGEVLTDFVVRLVTRWTVKGDYDMEEGKFVVSDAMYPLTYEKVVKLPALFLGNIVQQITEHSQPGR